MRTNLCYPGAQRIKELFPVVRDEGKLTFYSFISFPGAAFLLCRRRTIQMSIGSIVFFSVSFILYILFFPH
jgi:hypothetical protein